MNKETKEMVELMKQILLSAGFQKNKKTDQRLDKGFMSVKFNDTSWRLERKVLICGKPEWRNSTPRKTSNYYKDITPKIIDIIINMADTLLTIK